jgi:hypothetical protein
MGEAVFNPVKVRPRNNKSRNSNKSRNNNDKRNNNNRLPLLHNNDPHHASCLPSRKNVTERQKERWRHGQTDRQEDRDKNGSIRCSLFMLYSVKNT